MKKLEIVLTVLFAIASAMYIIFDVVYINTHIEVYKIVSRIFQYLSLSMSIAWIVVQCIKLAKK